ncbi:MAG: response regulator [Anaerolineae bacterium]|nr:response regulator [Anaerolineae bacterium]
MSGEKILVVDDRRENLLFLANSILRPEGYRVVTAMDGKDGLDKALAERPDLIIMDLKMPRMSGLEVLAALRKADCDTPVILTTFYGSEQAAIMAFRQGVKDYIIKPYEVKEMLDAVERALGEQRLRRETMGLKEGVEVSRHLEERVRQLHSLCTMNKALISIQDPDEVMRVAVEAAFHLTGAESGQLFLVNADIQQLECRAARGTSDSRARCLRMPGADPAAAEVARTGQAMFVQRNAGAGRAMRLVVPMRVGDKVGGVLAVDAKADHPFADNDRYLLGILADFTAVALNNSQTIDALRTQLAAAPELGAGRAEGGSLQPSTVDMAESISDAQRLAQELRDLAVTAHALALRLQVQAK